jgi:oligopeptide transport system substrate-binding protein
MLSFHDNKCFPNGKGRALTANDFVYSLKRLADPKNTSPGWWLLDGKIAGLNEWRDSQKTAEMSNYDSAVTGLKAVDNHTLQIKLSKPFPQFLYALSMTFTYVVPKEAVAYYGKEFLNNPVGTGPYITGAYNPMTNKIIYTKNPTFRDKFYPTEGSEGDEQRGLLVYKGRKVPFIEKIITRAIPESTPAWLSFLKGDIDELQVEKDNFDQAITPSKGLTDKLASKGIEVEMENALDVTYMGFNHKNKLLNNINLRRAISLAYNNSKANELFYNGLGIEAQTLIPPGIKGYDKDFKNPYTAFDVEKAKKLLDKAGYPGGKGLPTITYDTISTTVYRQMAEFLVKQMQQIGITVKPVFNTWPELQKKIKTAQVMMYGISWIADYPDAENFLQLVYGPNSAPGANGSNYNEKEFNRKFEIATKLQDSPKRTQMYKELAQSVSKKLPWVFGVHRTNFRLKHSWLKNYKGTEFKQGIEQYWDIDLEEKRKNLEKL